MQYYFRCDESHVLMCPSLLPQNIRDSTMYRPVSSVASYGARAPRVCVRIYTQIWELIRLRLTV